MGIGCATTHLGDICAQETECRGLETSVGRDGEKVEGVWDEECVEDGLEGLGRDG